MTCTNSQHAVLGVSIRPPFPAGMHTAYFALGCFWGAEKVFWQLPGVHSTAVGYAGGDSENPTYAQICNGDTDHAETVLVVFDPAAVEFDALLRVFWESHDPTQGMRQGNDIGRQYRSAVFAAPAQFRMAAQSKADYQVQLTRAGFGKITTEILLGKKFYYAEPEHQQYLAKNPDGYCGLGGTGVAFV